MTEFYHPLRIAVVQFRPQIGQVKANIVHAGRLCSKLKRGSIDILCFPEMAMTGYVFDSAKSILPYLEDPKTGPSSKFYSRMAKKLGCYVAGGFPERLAENEQREQETEISQEPTSQPRLHATVGANSASIFGPNGEWFGGYRKTNLFQIDETWAKPGTGFGTFSLPLSITPTSSRLDHPPPSHTLKVTLGICMDLNPRPPLRWTTLEGPYELADHCKKHQSDLLLLLNAWLHSDTSTDLKRDHDTEKPSGLSAEEPDWHTLRYWANRLRPLWRRSGDEDGGHGLDPSDKTLHREERGRSHPTTVVVCNRTGVENGYTFAGSSAIYSMDAGEDRPMLLERMGCEEEGVCVRTVEIRM